MNSQQDGFSAIGRPNTLYRRLLIGSIIWAALATICGAYFSFYSLIVEKHRNRFESMPSGKRNVIFMVSDGMGPASVALARNFFEHQKHGDEEDNNSRYGGHYSDLSTIDLDKHFIGNSRTQSSNSYVTDSAAGATAFSCGLKTYNGAIGVDSYAQPCATIMEAAKLMGYHTGLVVTTRVTDATPASFAAHAIDRSEEDFIAEQLVNYNDAHPFGPMVDLIFGGGRCHFLPQGMHGSCRSDKSDLIEHIKSDGWNYITDIEGSRALDGVPSLPMLGLFADGDSPFNIDYHDDSLPKLNETASTAVYALESATKDSEQGFFLMIEGSRIDHGGHSNDPAAQVREVLGFSDAFQAMSDYAKHADVPTIVVSTSDHETGGLSVSRQVTTSYPEYLWKPEVLARAQHSTEFVARELRKFARKNSHSKDAIKDFVKTNVVGEHGLNFEGIKPDEIDDIVEHAHDSQDILSRMLSVRAQVGWSTHGHSAVDVNVYGDSNFPHVLDPVRGGNENIDIGHYLREFLSIKHRKIEDLTLALREKYADRLFSS